MNLDPPGSVGTGDPDPRVTFPTSIPTSILATTHGLALLVSRLSSRYTYFRSARSDHVVVSLFFLYIFFIRFNVLLILVKLPCCSTFNLKMCWIGSIFLLSVSHQMCFASW